MNWELPIGANVDANGTRFRVWAANARQVELLCYNDAQLTQTHELTSEGDGFFCAHLVGIGAGTRYMYRIDGGDPRPDPASRFQPEGVHGPSQVVDPAAFAWSDANWRGVALDDLVIYELHVGTATPEGTFDALISRLDDLRDLGISAIELMPVADFPGQRNWGYDGVSLFAPSRAYGGPTALRRLVDAAHQRGLAVILDVVYNHLGPDGNYLRQFSKAYFTHRHTTPWGDALNFDGPESRPVRDFFIANALYWAYEYHIDGLRLDATHAIIDDSPTHILAELAARLHSSLPADRAFVLIAENEHNDPQLLRVPSAGGYGLDAVWADDFHHQLRVGLAGDRDGYYADYSGQIRDLVATLRQGWFYTGQYSTFLRRSRGAPAPDIAPPHFIYCIQNHDQVGNRALGDRLNHTVELSGYRAATVLLLCSPYTPLLWMGQEWAASAPFLYFTDHNPELGRLVTKGRRSEFASFTAFSGTEVPDPQADATFLRSKLRWEERTEAPHAGVLRLTKDLLALRRQHPALRNRDRTAFGVAALGETALALRRNGPTPSDTLLLLFNLRNTVEIELAAHTETTAPPGYRWRLLLTSEDPGYGGQSGIQLDQVAQHLYISGAGATLLQLAPASPS